MAEVESVPVQTGDVQSWVETQEVGVDFPPGFKEDVDRVESFRDDYGTLPNIRGTNPQSRGLAANLVLQGKSSEEIVQGLKEGFGEEPQEDAYQRAAEYYSTLAAVKEAYRDGVQAGGEGYPCYLGVTSDRAAEIMEQGALAPGSTVMVNGPEEALEMANGGVGRVRIETQTESDPVVLKLMVPKDALVPDLRTPFMKAFRLDGKSPVAVSEMFTFSE